MSSLTKHVLFPYAKMTDNNWSTFYKCDYRIAEHYDDWVTFKFIGKDEDFDLSLMFLDEVLDNSEFKRFIIEG